MAQILLDHHAVHGGGRAERRDIVFGEHGQNLMGVEPLEIVDKDRALAEPLAVELAPQCLAPAGVGNGQMQAVPLDTVPVFGGDKVAQHILIAVGGDFGIAGGAGGKEHQHGVVAAGGVGLPDKPAGEQTELGVEVVPAVAAAAHENLRLQAGTLALGLFNLPGGVAGGRGHNGADLGGLEAVHIVVFLQLIRGGNGHSAQLVEAQNGKPELIMAFQHQHDPVTPLNAQGFEVVGRLAGIFLDILEGEAALVQVLVDVEHGQLVGVGAAQTVHGVKGEIVMVIVDELNFLQRAPLVLGGLDEFLAQQGQLAVGGAGGEVGERLLFVAVAVHNHGQERAVLAVHGNHAVGGGGFIVDAVTGVEDLLMVAHADPQGALQHQVELVALVGGGGDGLGLLGFGIGIADVVGVRQAVFEQGRHVLNQNAVLIGGGDALALAGDGVGGQTGAFALQKVCDADAEGQRTLVDKGKGQIHLAGFIAAVLLHGGVGLLGHLRHGESADGAHFRDTRSDLQQLVMGYGVGFHGSNLLKCCKVLPGKGIKKAVPKQVTSFETE